MAAVGLPVWTPGVWADTVWAAGVWAEQGTLTFVGDMNTRLLVYLRDYYSVSGGDLTTLSTRYMNGLTTGDRNQKWAKLVQDATNAMT